MNDDDDNGDDDDAMKISTWLRHWAQRHRCDIFFLYTFLRNGFSYLTRSNHPHEPCSN